MGAVSYIGLLDVFLVCIWPAQLHVVSPAHVGSLSLYLLDKPAWLSFSLLVLRMLSAYLAWSVVLGQVCPTYVACFVCIGLTICPTLFILGMLCSYLACLVWIWPALFVIGLLCSYPAAFQLVLHAS